MQKITNNNRQNSFLLTSQRQLLNMMSEFIDKRDEGLRSNTVSVKDIRNGEQQFLDLVVKGTSEISCVDDYHIPASDISGEKILLRIYDPLNNNNDRNDDASNNSSSLTPCLIYIHGGGGVQLSVQFYDYVLRYLSNSSGLKVAAMNYRLAPEYPFPTGLNDVLDTIRWIVKNGEKLGIDKYRLALGGDSAGANMALASALRIRNGDVSNIQPTEKTIKHLLRGLFLIYGHYSPNVMKSESMQIFGEKEWSFTTKTYLGWYLKHLHQNKEDYNNQYAFPLLADTLKELPPTYIVTTSTDTYRDDNIDLAEKFEQEKQEYYLTMWPGVMHASINLLCITPEVQKYIDSMTAFLGGILQTR
ncbi:MAG: alpha/beta hydrolase [Candidatus Nitrosocosmicus sp.]|nr:alpha/beta hydrolase [Candidatus Nitrosocosmicus sp.]MDN5867769.1 alpha/beta hydrolase [Candidatus Nitrosocosmicus sp.]